ncbi:MAG TPA: carbohydrate porin [Acetobacteraceae bacterium]|jgi:porin
MLMSLMNAVAARQNIPLARVVAPLLAFVMTAAAARSQPAPPTTDFWHRDSLTGDWGGERTALADAGVTFTMTYTGDLQDVVQGGIRRGGVYDSLLQPQIDLDLDKLAGWTGATAHFSLLGIAGPSLSASYAGNLINTSSINGRPAIRLYNAWLQQDIGMASIRAGLMNADAEFFISQTASLFVDSTFGWPAILGVDLPGGGPAYPLSSPGARVKLQPTPELAVMAAVFSGDPTGQDGTNMLSTRQPDGTLISFTGGALAIAEAAYSLNQGKDAKGMPVTFKLGGWYHSSAHFEDQRFDTNGLSLADPASNKLPRGHDGDWGWYGIADVTLYQAPGGNGGSLSGFARIAGTPDDENLVGFYADSGLAYKGLLPTRADDTAGVAVAYARIGNRARSLDLDYRQLDDLLLPVRNQEIVLEVSYQAQVTPWWTLQPDAQVIFNPDGHVANSAGSVRQNALLLGMRTVVTF